MHEHAPRARTFWRRQPMVPIDLDSGHVAIPALASFQARVNQKAAALACAYARARAGMKCLRMPPPCIQHARYIQASVVRTNRLGRQFKVARRVIGAVVSLVERPFANLIDTLWPAVGQPILNPIRVVENVGPAVKVFWYTVAEGGGLRLHVMNLRKSRGWVGLGEANAAM